MKTNTMKRITSIILLFVSIMVCNEAFTQVVTPYQYTFGLNDHVLGEKGEITSDGGYMMAGLYGSGGVYDFCLMKADNNYVRQWAYSYGGAGNDRLLDAAQVNDGGFVMVGNTNSFGGGTSNALIIKVNSAGVEQWSKVLETSSWTHFEQVTATSDGGCIATGFITGVGAGSSDIYVVKFASNGTVSWRKAHGGAGSDKGMWVEQLSDGTYIVTGETGTWGAGNQDVFLIKMSSNGNEQWTKTYGGTNWDAAHS